MKNYYPVFNITPQNRLERWVLIRKFIENWHGIELPETTDVEDDIERIEAELNIKLPVSFREYIKLSKQLMVNYYDYPNGYRSSQYNHVFRDYYKVEKLKEHNAISLMIQAENDLYWAVKIEDLQHDDPPVHMYVMDFDSDTEKFDYYKLHSHSISGFALNHMSNFLHRNNAGGFGTSVKKNEPVLDVMRDFFDTYTQLDDITIYEKENVFALISPNVYDDDNDEYHLCLELWKNIDMSLFPEPILKLTGRGGSFHGVFTDIMNRYRIKK